MADIDPEVKETTTRGADWEVVSLTASAYAATAGPEPEETGVADINRNLQRNEESARALFMSGHFVFPPSEHENLPLEPDNSEILAEPLVQDTDPTEIEEECDGTVKTQERNWSSVSFEDLKDIQFFDKGRRVSVYGVEIEESNRTLEDLNLVGEMQGMIEGPGFRYFCTESNLSGSISNDESNDVVETEGPPKWSANPLSKSIKKSKNKGSGFPLEAWWKRQATLLYAHAKEAGTFWSLCVAAAVMGLVILGQRWQQERWQIHQLKTKFTISNEITGRFFGRVTHFKDAIIGGHRRTSFIRGGLPADY